MWEVIPNSRWCAPTYIREMVWCSTLSDEFRLVIDMKKSTDRWNIAAFCWQHTKRRKLMTSWKIVTPCGQYRQRKKLCTCQYSAHPGVGGGGNTRGFRQKTIFDKQDFDKLMDFGSREIDFGRFSHPGNWCTKQAQGWGFRQKWLSLGWGFRLQIF